VNKKMKKKENEKEKDKNVCTRILQFNTSRNWPK